MSAWTVIQHTEISSATQASITFMSVGDIPSTYTDLVLVVSGRTDNASIQNSVALRFNGDTGSNYTYRRLFGNGSSTGSDSGTHDRLLIGYVSGANATSSTFGSVAIYIPNYRSSTAKSVSGDGVNENNGTNGNQSIVAGLWSGTNPITSITVLPFDTANWVQYTSATLYGVTKGSSGGVTVS